MPGMRNPGTDFSLQTDQTVTNNPTAAVSTALTTISRMNNNLLQTSVAGGRYQTDMRKESNIFNVLDYGADPSGATDSAAAIQAAITACQVANGATFANNDPWSCTAFSRGGCVYIPAGLYQITRTLIINGALGFKIHGDSATTTRIIWNGTQGTNRWSATTAYTVGQTVAAHGFTYICTQAGTSGTSASGPNSVGTGISDTAAYPAWTASHGYIAGEQVNNSGNVYVCSVAGTSASSGGPSGTGPTVTDGGVTWTYAGPFTAVLWNYVGVDKFSDMVQFRSYLACEIADIEFTGAIGTVAVNSGATRPRSVICSYIDPPTRVLSNSALKIRDIDINWSVNNTGLPNQQDYGVLYDNGQSELNNSEGHIYNLQINGSSRAAVYLSGTQCQDNHFWRCNVSSANTVAVQTVNSSFTISDSNVGCVSQGTVFVLGQSNDRIVIDRCVNEGAGRFLTAGGTIVANHGAFNGSQWNIIITNNRLAQNGLVPDGYFIIIGNRGPLIFSGNVMDGGTPGSAVPKMSLATSGDNWPALITGNAFIWNNATQDPLNQSIVDTTLNTAGVKESGNTYVSSKYGVTLMRAEQGSFVCNAFTPTAWAQSTAYTVGQYVTTSNGKSLKCVVAGTSSATGTGPTGTCHADRVFETDGTAQWLLWTASTDATTRAWNFEVPMCNTSSWKIMPFISARSNAGGSTGSTTITGVTRTISGFAFTLSAPPTGSDTLTIDWMMHQGS